MIFTKNLRLNSQVVPVLPKRAAPKFDGRESRYCLCIVCIKYMYFKAFLFGGARYGRIKININIHYT